MAVELVDIGLLATVSLLASFHLTTFARRVGVARKKFEVPYPKTSGHDGFERVYRAQMNCLEFFPIYLVTMWVAGLFFHQVPAALVGLVYIFARESYFRAYSQSVASRVPPFKMAVRCLMLLLAMCVIGIASFYLRHFGIIDLKQKASKMFYGQ